jgi:ankyrin repeat protein
MDLGTGTIRVYKLIFYITQSHCVMLTVILTLHRKSYSLAKDFLLTSLPQCLLSEALRGDPSVTEITITHPDVKPKAMEILVTVSQGKEPKKHHSDISLAHRYLNIPQLLVYAEPLYSQIPNRANIPDPRNAKVWKKAILGNRDVVMTYFLTKGWQPSYEDLITAIVKNQVTSVKVLLNKGNIDPSSSHNFPIRCATAGGKIEIVKILLEDKRVDPTDDSCNAIGSALHRGNPELVRLLLDDARVPHAIDYNETIIWAAMGGNLEVVRMLLVDPRVDPAAYNNKAIRIAAILGHSEVVALLLADPRVNPADCNNEAVQEAARCSHNETVRLLTRDPRVTSIAVSQTCIIL